MTGSTRRRPRYRASTVQTRPKVSEASRLWWPRKLDLGYGIGGSSVCSFEAPPRTRPPEPLRGRAGFGEVLGFLAAGSLCGAAGQLRLARLLRGEGAVLISAPVR
jgi:hypothetical protein